MDQYGSSSNPIYMPALGVFGSEPNRATIADMCMPYSPHPSATTAATYNCRIPPLPQLRNHSPLKPLKPLSHSRLPRRTAPPS